MSALLFASLCVSSLHAQTSTPAQELPEAPAGQAPQPAPQSAPQTDRHREAEREVKEEEKQRIAGVIPDFNVVMSGQAVPLDKAEKFDIAFHSIIDPYAFGLAAIAGGIGEIEDSHTGFGHGPAGYFKRAGANYADNAIGTMVGNALLPVILHQDPRYFRKGTGSIKSRIIYSALTTFICRSDSGKLEFNTSNVLGNFISGGISNLYYPANERGVGLTIENATIVTFEGALGAQLLEFSPDVTGYIKRRHQRKLAAAALARGNVAKTTPAP